LILIIALLAAVVVYRLGKLEKSKAAGPEPLPQTMEDMCRRVRERIDEVLLKEPVLKAKGKEKIRERDRARKDRIRLLRAVRDSCLGDFGEREFLKDYIKTLIIDMLGDRYGRSELIIPFDRPQNMTPHEKFEHMYMCYSVLYGRDVYAQMSKDFGWDDKNVITSEDIESAYGDKRQTGDYNDMLETVVQRIYELLYGHDCVDLLINDGSLDCVSAGVGGRTRLDYDYLRELVSSGNDSSRSFDTVYCVYKGRTIRLKFLTFSSEGALERVVKNIYRYNCATSLSQRNPVIHATMKDNSRVMVSRPPVSDGYAFYVRKYKSSSPSDIHSLLVHEGADDVIDILIRLVREEYNFCISGNTGGGKTTLLKALVAYINPLYAIRVVESSFELDLNNLYPERNIHMLQERGNFSIYDAITATKKMDTDVLLIGEVNEPKVAGAFIQISQSGSRMAVTTLHHETTKKLIEYMRNALMCEFGITDAAVAQRQVVDSIGFDVHMVRDTFGRHYVERITQIIPAEEKEGAGYLLRDIIVFDKDELRYRKTGEIFEGGRSGYA